MAKVCDRQQEDVGDKKKKATEKMGDREGQYLLSIPCLMP